MCIRDRAAAVLVPTDVEMVALLADHPRLVMRLGHSGALRWVRHPGLRGALEELARRGGTAKRDAQALAAAGEPTLRAQGAAAALSGRYADVVDPERALQGI